MLWRTILNWRFDPANFAEIAFDASKYRLSEGLPKRYGSENKCTSNAQRNPMSHDAIIEQLNECLKHEWTGVAQYSQASFIVEGVWREVYAKTLMENAEESFGHAKLVGDKIVALGGVPAATRNEIKQTRDLQQILENSLAFEAKAVEMYGRALEMAEAINDRPLVIFLENILEEEQEGVDEFTKLLRNSDTASSSSVDAKSA